MSALLFGALSVPQAHASPTPVVVIVMENHTFGAITNSGSAPYINNTLIPGGREFTNYHAETAVASLMDYLALTSGSFQGCGADSCPTDTYTANNLFHQVTNRGFTVRSFEESMPSPCDSASGGHSGDSLYWNKHNPEIYFTDTQVSGKGSAPCADDDLSTPLDPNNLASFSLVTPNICHDMHGNTNAGCPSGTNAIIAAGDTWLANNVPALAAHATVFVTWDEGTTANSQVLTLETGVGVTQGKDTTSYPDGHYSLLAGLETYYGAVKLGGAATATAIPIP